MRQGSRAAALLVVLGALCVLGLATGAPAATLTAPDCSASVPTSGCPYIASASYGGTGCPQGTVGSSLSSDRRRFTAIYASFVASTGPGVPVTESRKNCQFNLDLTGFEADTGAQQVTVDLRGYAQLDAALSGSTSFLSYFQGNPLSSGSLDIAGPAARDYLLHRTIVVPAGPAGSVTPLNLNSQVRLLGAGTGQLTIDSLDVAIGPADPQALLDQLRADVAAAGLDHGLASDLDNKLREAGDKLAKGKPNDVKNACKKLDDFTRKVTDEAGKQKPKIDADDASAWTDAAAQIRLAIGCS